MKQVSVIIFGMLALLLVVSVVSISESEAKKYTVFVKYHLEKICPGDKLYFRMADNTKDAVTGEHRGLVWKTPYFTETKTDQMWKVKVDSKKVPSGRLVTYDEVERDEKEIHDEYQHKTLKNNLVFAFNIPAFC